MYELFTKVWLFYSSPLRLLIRPQLQQAMALPWLVIHSSLRWANHTVRVYYCCSGFIHHGKVLISLWWSQIQFPLALFVFCRLLAVKTWNVLEWFFKGVHWSCWRFACHVGLLSWTLTAYWSSCTKRKRWRGKIMVFKADVASLNI